jgi:hypothetical protein
MAKEAARGEDREMKLIERAMAIWKAKLTARAAYYDQVNEIRKREGKPVSEKSNWEKSLESLGSCLGIVIVCVVILWGGYEILTRCSLVEILLMIIAVCLIELVMRR